MNSSPAQLALDQAERSFVVVLADVDIDAD